MTWESFTDADEHGGDEPSKDDESSLGAFEGNAGPAARGDGVMARE